MSETKSLLVTAVELMGRMRYQIFSPEVTTLGQCPGCPSYSRGAQLCPACLTRELGYIVGERAAREYHTALLNSREAELTVKHLAGDDNG